GMRMSRRMLVSTAVIMLRPAVDTNILLDILIPDAQHADRSQRALDRALADGALVICEVVYAELASQFCKAE
ncbi:MAG: PIN domain-containing protein, partial [Candidatus Bipolaricaulota bacterium]